MPRTKPRIVTAVRNGTTPIVTYSLIGVTIAVFALQYLTGGTLTNDLAYWAPLTAAEPWRMITAMFVHSQQSLLHIVFNMYSLFVLGPSLESLLGRGRFTALYFISGFGGSVAVLLLAPATPVIGASGAIFGLLGAYFVIQRHFGGNSTQLVIVILINLAMGFVVPGIAWQAHVGGLIAGAAIAFVFVRTRRIDQKWMQIGLIAAVAVALVVITVIGVNYWF